MNIDGKTRLLGLLGDPVEHTMSPVIHNTLSDVLGFNEVYVPFHTTSEGLKNAVKGAYDLNILGMNATVPHKNAVMDMLVDIDAGAKAIGAVNTLVRVEGGYKGYNTDMMGLSRELDVYGISLKERNAVILGAGVASDMNRYFKKDIFLPVLLADYEKLYDEYNDEKFVVFQSTSIGLAPHNEDVVIDDSRFYELIDVGIDLIYNPFETKFMRLCRENGAKAYNGLRMLLYQGIIAYELWNNISVAEDVADIVYNKMLKSVRKNIILIGFMGCGKTTVGTAVAGRLGYNLLDVDLYIEKEAGCSISQIFADKGEQYFRELETDTLKKLNASISHTVISTGGGLPMRPENAEELRKLGTVIYLDVQPEEVIRRLSGDTSRPLLQGDDVERKVNRLMDERRPVYESEADCVIPVTGRDVEEIVDELVCIVE